MINVAICDDNIETTGKMDSILCNIAKKNFIPAETEVFWDGKHLVDAVETGIRFDIIFLDIEMEKEDGITAARKIREVDKNVLIVYVTRSEEHTSELQSRFDLVCRLLLEKKKGTQRRYHE